MMRRTLFAILCVAALLVPATSQAEIPIYESEDYRFSFAGYVLSVGGIYHISEEASGGFAPEATGLSTNVVRFEWQMDFGTWLTLEVHDRFFLQTTSESLGSIGGVGAGASRVPNRTVDLSADIVGESGDALYFQHDLDRLTLKFFFDPFDLYIGRQAISWGNGLIFTPADLWAQLSPFDLDSSQKRGIDAARAVIPAGDIVEVDVVIADRGSVEDLSGGVKANIFLESGDLYVALGKFWDEVILLSGVSIDLGNWDFSGTARVEIIAPYDIETETFELPRATAGFDYFYSEAFTLIFEYHYNGAGVTDAAEYFSHALTDKRIARGETYLIGAHYLGLGLQYKPYELLTFGASTLFNILDPSAMLMLSMTYQIQQDVSIALGAFQSVGSNPDFSGFIPVASSEFGSGGGMYYLQMNAFF